MLTELWWEDPWHIFNTSIATSLLVKEKKKNPKPYIGNDRSFYSLSRSRERRKYITVMPWLNVPKVKHIQTVEALLSGTSLVISKSAKIK